MRRRFFLLAVVSTTTMVLGACGGTAEEADKCSYNGSQYKTGDVFCATDGCNSCQCNPEGTTGVGCSTKDCKAAGVVVADVCK